MSQSIDTFLSDFGVSESIHDEEVINVRWGQIYTRFDIMGEGKHDEN